MSQQVLDYKPPDLPRQSPRPRRPATDALASFLADYTVLLLTVVYFAAVLPFVPQVASSGNLSNIFATMLPLLAVAVGQTVVMITGGIDLSVGSVVALSSVTGALVMNDKTGLLARSPWSVPAAVAVMLGVGLVVGLCNGVFVALLRMPAFIVTLTTMMFVSGVAIWATKSKNVADLPQSFIAIDKRSLFGLVHYPLIIVAMLAAAAQLMLRRTLVGRWLFAVGMNPKAATVSGVPVAGTVVFAYALSGLCAGVASILLTARLRTGSPTLGGQLLLDVIGAVVIGGTSLFGGKGSVVKTAFGVLFLSLIANTLNWFDLEHASILIVKGGVIVMAAALDLLRNKVLAAEA